MKNQTLQSEALSILPSALLNMVLESLPDATALVDSNFRLLLFNTRAQNLVRKKLSQDLVADTSLLSILPTRLHAPFHRFFAIALRGYSRSTEVMLHQQYSVVHQISFLPARNENGLITGVLITAKNITRQKQKERLLLEAEERWQVAFEASNQAAWDWNMQTDEVVFSTSYKTLFGFAEEELRGPFSGWQSRVHPDDREQLNKAIEEHSQSAEPVYETTYRVQLNNGEYKWIMARGKLISRDEQGRPLRMIGTHTDLTETLQTKEEIQRSNERFLYAAKASSQALWEWNAENGEVYVSPSFTEIFGWEHTENTYFEQWHSYIHPDEQTAVVNHYYQTLQDPAQNIWQSTYRLRKRDGSYATVSDKAFLLRNESGKIVRVIGATEDITALKKVEEELRRTNERYDMMLLATNDLLFEWDVERNHVIRPKKGIRNVYGIADETKVQTVDHWLSYIHPEDRASVEQKLSAVLNGSHLQTFEVEYRLRNDAGDYNHVLGRAIIIADKSGKPIRVIGSEQNVTERRRLEASLLQNELETKKRINQATVDSQEQERSQIGRELHDNINQILTTTKLFLEVATAADEQSADLLRRAGGNIASVINEIRQLSRSLMDPTIGDLGITDAITDLVETLRLTRKVQISLLLDEDIEHLLDRRQKLTVFRILQEAMNNVMRHAQASEVRIRLQRDDSTLVLEITDNGAGFAANSVKRGAGLKNISNRVYLANGSFEVLSNPGAGCTILIRLPFLQT